MSTNIADIFYREISSTFNDENSGSFSCEIELNPKHKVYEGHFPNISVAPGVLLIKTIKDILIEKFKTDLVLAEGNNIKFTALINPDEVNKFRVDFTVKKNDDTLDVSAQYVNGENNFTKFKGKFKIKA